MKKRCLAVFLICLLLGVLPVQAPGETMHREVSNPAFEMEASLGYDGMITYGKMFPLRIRIRNFGADFQGRVGVNTYLDLRQYNRYETEIDLPGGSEREVILPVAVFSRQDLFTVELTRDGETAAAVNVMPEGVIDPSALMVGVLSTRPVNLATMNITKENDVLMRYEYWQTVPLTADTLPEDERLLKSFGILVVDDVTLDTLKEGQRKALMSWLEKGRVLILGGGSAGLRNLMSLSTLTGVTAEGVSASDSALEAMEAFSSANRSARNPLLSVARLDGANPILRDGEGQPLLYRTPVGNGSLYTLAWEPGDPQLSGEAVSHFFWQSALVSQDSALYNTLQSETGTNQEYQPALCFAGYTMPVKAGSRLLPGVILIAAGLVLGLVAWLVLKKMDKRQWMWLAIPVITLAVGGGVMGLSLTSEVNGPMAVAATGILQTAPGRVYRYTGISAATPYTGIHTFSGDGGKLTIQSYDYPSYYPEEEEEESREPFQLRYCYIDGQDQGISVNMDSPWEIFSLSADTETEPEGKTDAAIWMERDGLHGMITNRTGTETKPGAVITPYGFAMIPAMAPGETVSYALLEGEPADPNNPQYEPGRMYRNQTPGIYQLSDQAIWLMYGNEPEEQTLNVIRSQLMIGLSNQLAELNRGARSQYGYGNDSVAQFLYFTEQKDQDWTTVIRLDGELVRRTQGIGLMGIEIQYESIGRTGVVFQPAGMNQAVRVAIDENGMPMGEMPLSGYSMYYHPLTEIPTFSFRIRDAERIQAEQVWIGINGYMDEQIQIFALDREQNTWTEVTPDGKLSSPERFIGEDGILYAQFRAKVSADYLDIPTPVLTLEGRVQNASN